MNNQTLSGILSLSKRKGLQNIGAFTFVELIISISILALISVIAFTALNKNTNNVNNAKIEAGTITLKNALLSYSTENKTLPNPSGNLNYFKTDSSYAHHTGDNAFGVYGSITEKTLPKKYLDSLPLDPVTNHYFSYGKTLDNKYFEIASILRESESDSTKLDGTYPGEYGPISLIREYNGSIFVSDKSRNHLPYNPNEHILIVTDDTGKIYHVGDEITTGTSETKTLYFSDGSISELKQNSSLTISELNFKNKENNLLTTIKLFLSSGEILTKATALNQEGSDFEIYTADTTAAVRGTIFSVSYNPNRTPKTIVSVLKGQVKIQNQNNTTEILNPIEGTGLQITDNKKNNSFSSIGTIETTTKDKLQIFANIFLPANQPVKVVTYVEPEATIEIETETETETKTEIETNCTATNHSSFTINTTINHNQSKTFTKIITSTSGNKTYKLTGTCNNGTITYGSVVGPIVSCNTGYKKVGNSCKKICDIGGIPGTENESGECITEDKINGLSLYAYAPYNGFDKKDLNTFTPLTTKSAELNKLLQFYTKDNKVIKPISYSFLDWHTNGQPLTTGYNNSILYNSSTKFLCSTKSGFYNSNICVVPNGVTLTESYHLKYSNLNLSGDFAIEMSILASALKRGIDNKAYTLFYLPNSFQLYIKNNQLVLLGKNNSGTWLQEKYNLGNYNGMARISMQYNNGNPIIRINGNVINPISDKTGYNTNLNYIYIGSTDSKIKQWNSIIDYIKIYN